MGPNRVMGYLRMGKYANRAREGTCDYADDLLSAVMSRDQVHLHSAPRTRFTRKQLGKKFPGGESSGEEGAPQRKLHEERNLPRSQACILFQFDPLSPNSMRIGEPERKPREIRRGKNRNSENYSPR